LKRFRCLNGSSLFDAFEICKFLVWFDASLIVYPWDVLIRRDQSRDEW
jgi:hypothetical protein